MKIFNMVLLIMILLTVNIYGFTENFEYGSFAVDDVTVPYRIYVPSDYNDTKYPVILYLHSAGERGSDNEYQLYGAPYYMFMDGFIERYPAIIIAPQCPIGEQWVDTDWTLGDYSTDEIAETPYLRITYEILMQSITDYNADINRIYITGISMGGYGTWDMLTRYPDTFAAGIPISGAGDSGNADKIKDIPIWSYHGDIDPVVPVSGMVKMAEAFGKIESHEFILTVYENTSHDAWTRTYRNENTWRWMFDQVKAEIIVEPATQYTLSHITFIIIGAVAVVGVIIAVIIVGKRR